MGFADKNAKRPQMLNSQEEKDQEESLNSKIKKIESVEVTMDVKNFTRGAARKHTRRRRQVHFINKGGFPFA
jgi:hypothetical protein